MSHTRSQQNKTLLKVLNEMLKRLGQYLTKLFARIIYYSSENVYYTKLKKLK